MVPTDPPSRRWVPVRRLLFWPWAALTGHYLFHHHAVAIFCAAGFLAAAALLRSLWRRYFSEVSMAPVAILFGVCAGVLGLFYGTCSRYEAEFLPTLVFLAVVGILAVERMLVSRPRWRVTARAVWVLLLVFSLGFNVLEGFEHYVVEHCLLGNHLDVAGRFADAIPQYQAALRINRRRTACWRSPLRRTVCWCAAKPQLCKNHNVHPSTRFRQVTGVGSPLAGDSHLGILLRQAYGGQVASRFDKLKAPSVSRGKLASYKLNRDGYEERNPRLRNIGSNSPALAWGTVDRDRMQA